MENMNKSYCIEDIALCTQIIKAQPANKRIVLNMNGQKLMVTPHMRRIARIALHVGKKLYLKGARA